MDRDRVSSNWRGIRKCMQNQGSKRVNKEKIDELENGNCWPTKYEISMKSNPKTSAAQGRWSRRTAELFISRFSLIFFFFSNRV